MQGGGRSDACMKDFMPLREEAEKRGKLIKAASDRHAPPEEACKLIENFGQAEIKMIKYVEANCDEVRDSAADPGAAEERPQEYRDHAEESLRGGQQAAKDRLARA